MTPKNFYEKMYRYMMNYVKILTDIHYYQMTMYDSFNMEKINDEIYDILIEIAIHIKISMKTKC